MKFKTIGLILFYSQIGFAAPPVTYQFTNGTTIEASQINSNYQELADRIEALQNQINELKGLSPKQLVGFTSVTYTSDQARGYPKINSDCDSQFTGSMMCKSSDIANSFQVSGIPSTPGWVRPNFIGAQLDKVHGQINGQLLLMDPSTTYLYSTISTSFILPAACCR